jgi:hypothetical protein
LAPVRVFAICGPLTALSLLRPCWLAEFLLAQVGAAILRNRRGRTVPYR